jgi:hypothetical protein
MDGDVCSIFCYSCDCIGDIVVAESAARCSSAGCMVSVHRGITIARHVEKSLLGDFRDYLGTSAEIGIICIITRMNDTQTHDDHLSIARYSPRERATSC